MENRLKHRFTDEEFKQLFPSFEEFESAAQTQILNNEDGHITANKDGTLTARLPFPINVPVNGCTVLVSPNGTPICFASNDKMLKSIAFGETEESAKQPITDKDDNGAERELTTNEPFFATMLAKHDVFLTFAKLKQTTDVKLSGYKIFYNDKGKKEELPPATGWNKPGHAIQPKLLDAKA